MSAQPIIPAEVWPMASFMAEEMEARGWTAVDVAQRMPGDYEKNALIVNLLLVVNKENLIIDSVECSRLGEAFGVDGEYFLNLHRYWLDHPIARQEFKCPEHLLGGLLFPDNDK